MIGAIAEPTGDGPRPTGMLRRTLAVAAFASLMTVAAPATHVFACTCMQVTPELTQLPDMDAAFRAAKALL